MFTILTLPISDLCLCSKIALGTRHFFFENMPDITVHELNLKCKVFYQGCSYGKEIQTQFHDQAQLAFLATKSLISSEI